MKAILVMEMPSSCLECPIGKDMSIPIETCIKCPIGKCVIDEEVMTKPDWCPLKKIPQKLEREIVKEDYNGGYSHGIVHGYNACIDEILGDKEREDEDLL